MPTLVDFPTIVQEALALFGDLFDTEPARRHFAAYLPGLIVAENKTIRGINRALALTTDQSCLNRWLTEVQWDVTALHDRRRAWRQQAPQTRYSVRGVIAIDNTLVDHAGKLIEQQFPLRVSASTVFWPFGHPLCFTAGLPATPSSKIACSGGHAVIRWAELSRDMDALPHAETREPKRWRGHYVESIVTRGLDLLKPYKRASNSWRMDVKA